jgi:hypothetical protein
MKATVPLLLVLILAGVSIAYAVTFLPRGPATTHTFTHEKGGATLEDLIAGKFPSATDKQGTNGVNVTVRGLQVLYVMDEFDGDWHVAVTDGNQSVFITEIIPSDQQALGRPTAGTFIDETGIPYCDVPHENEAWHGNTCWEIHPVKFWALSGRTATTSTT